VNTVTIFAVTAEWIPSCWTFSSATPSAIIKQKNGF
jgi:hypothetical protein